MNPEYRQVESGPAPTTVLFRWLPAAFVVFFGCLLVSARIHFVGRPFKLADALMSVLLSRTDNPRGYLVAAAGTALAGVLQFPAAELFLAGLQTISRRWGAIGAGVYGAGLAASVVLGIIAPFQSETFGQFHIYTAFFSFMAITAGLGVCLSVAASGRLPGRWCLAGLVAIQSVSTGFLGYIFIIPYPPEGFGPWTSLAALEWELALSIAISTTALAIAVKNRILPPASR